jgi:hypothetical protein
MVAILSRNRRMVSSAADGVFAYVIENVFEVVRRFVADL